MIDEKLHECEGDTCIEHWQEFELKCPYCLHEKSDSYEVLRGEDSESGTATCGYCDREYEYGTTITYKDGGVETIYYTTYPKEDADTKVIDLPTEDSTPPQSDFEAQGANPQKN